jgi:hypothetical protein
MPGGRDVRAGGAFVEIFTKDKALEAGLDRAAKRLKSFGDAANDVGKNMAKFTGLALAPIALAGRLFATMGDQIAKASVRTGIAAEQLSALRYAAEQSGTDFAGLENGVRHMQKTLTEAAAGSEEATDALRSLGLTVGDLSGLKPDEQFRLIADQIAKIPDATFKAATAMKVFGKSGTELLPLMEGGSAGIRELEQAAKRLGLTMDTATAKAAEEFGDRVDDLGKVAKMAAFNVGAALAPSLREVALATTAAAAKASEWIREHRDVVATAGKVVLGLATLTAGTAGLAFAVGKAAESLRLLARAASLAIAHPIVAGVTAAASAFLAARAAIDAYVGSLTRLNDASAAQLRAGDEQRSLDALRLQRLEQLAQKTEMSVDESREAKGLLDSLGKTYGDLGASVDVAAGRLVRFAQAQAKVNAALRASALAQVNAEIAEAKANLGKVGIDAKGDGVVAGLLSSAVVMTTGRTPGRFDPNAEENAAQRAAIRARLAALESRKAALAGGDSGAAVGESSEADRLRGALGRDPLTADQLNARKAAIDAAKQLAQLEEEERKKRGDAFDQQIRETRELAAEQIALIDRIAAGTEDTNALDRLRGRQTQIVADTEAKVLDLKRQQAEAAAKVREAQALATKDLARQLAEQQGDRVASAKLEAEIFRRRERARLDEAKLSPGARKQADRLIDQIGKGIEAQPGKEAKELVNQLHEQALEAAGDAAGAAKLRADQFRQEQAERIKGLGLTGKDLADAQSYVEQIAKRMEQPDVRATVQGTFNSAAVGYLGGGGDVLNRQLAVQQKIERNTNRQADGPRFR